DRAQRGAHPAHRQRHGADAARDGRPGGGQPDRLPGARPAEDAAEPGGGEGLMDTLPLETWLLLALAAVNLVLLLWLLLRRPPPPDGAVLSSVVGAAVDKSERSLRQELAESARATRQESAQQLATFQQTLLAQGAETARTQNAQIDAFAQQLARMQGSLGETLNSQLHGLTESNARRLAEVRAATEQLAQTLNTQLQALSETNPRRMAEVRATMEQQLAQLQASNATKLDEMRQVVDEKLQTTLEARLGESFKQVAER